jgi:RNA-binding protein 5/10
MGYNPLSSSGLGLGKDGTGIAQPIETNVYSPGVGLGAEGGKRGDAIIEAERETRGGEAGYRGFVERVREGAKARYENLREGE